MVRASTSVPPMATRIEALRFCDFDAHCVHPSNRQCSSIFKCTITSTACIDISFHTVKIVINDQPPRAGRRFHSSSPPFSTISEKLGPFTANYRILRTRHSASLCFCISVACDKMLTRLQHRMETTLIARTADTALMRQYFQASAGTLGHGCDRTSEMQSLATFDSSSHFWPRKPETSMVLWRMSQSPAHQDLLDDQTEAAGDHT